MPVARLSLKPSALLLTLLLAALLAPLSFAAAPSVDFVQLRIAGKEDDVSIEMPVQVLEYLKEHSKGSCDVGSIRGRNVKFPTEELFKIIREKKAQDKEVLFFTGEDEHSGPLQFYVKTTTRKAPARATKPEKLGFAVKENGKEKLRLSISMDSVQSFATDFSGDAKEGEDFGPFVRSCLASVKDLGAGPVLTISSRDGELAFFLE